MDWEERWLMRETDRMLADGLFDLIAPDAQRPKPAKGTGYVDGYLIGKALGHAIHREDWEPQAEAGDTPDYLRGMREGYTKGRQNWQEECALIAAGKTEEVQRRWLEGK